MTTCMVNGIPHPAGAGFGMTGCIEGYKGMKRRVFAGYCYLKNTANASLHSPIISQKRLSSRSEARDLINLITSVFKNVVISNEVRNLIRFSKRLFYACFIINWCSLRPYRTYYSRGCFGFLPIFSP